MFTCTHCHKRRGDRGWWRFKDALVCVDCSILFDQAVESQEVAL